MGYYLDPTIATRIVELVKAGKSARAITRELGVHQDTVAKYARPIRSKIESKIRKPLPIKSLSPIPGICACGCGGLTSKYIQQDVARGKPVGAYRKWIKGHFCIAQRMANARSGLSQLKIIAQRNRLRADMVAAFHQDRFATRDDIVERFLPQAEVLGTDKPNLTRIFINGLIDESYKLNQDELSVPPVRPKPGNISLEEYVRKPISYENETDIKYLSRSWKFLSLDDTTDHENGIDHHRLAYNNLDPAEIMMLAEEDEEKADYFKRRDHFLRWQEMHQPLNALTDVFGSVLTKS